MHNQQTIEKLQSMRLPAMAKHFRQQLENPGSNSLSFEERFAMLVDAEYTQRHQNGIKKLLDHAKLRIPAACLEDLDFSPQRKLDKAYIARISEASWVKEHRNMIITGATGTGKTYLSCAIGSQLCSMGFKVRYSRVSRLLADLAIGRGDGSYNKILRNLNKFDVLILDDWGMTTLDPMSSRDLLEVAEDRFGRKSVVVSSQVPVSEWHSAFEDSTVADAVLDRLIHNSHRIELYGPSLRSRSPASDMSEKKKSDF